MNLRETIIMTILMTIMMGLVLSGVFTWQAIGFGSSFLETWLGRFAKTYVIVLPTVLVVSPVARWMTIRLGRVLDGARVIKQEGNN